MEPRPYSCILVVDDDDEWGWYYVAPFNDEFVRLVGPFDNLVLCREAAKQEDRYALATSERRPSMGQHKREEP